MLLLSSVERDEVPVQLAEYVCGRIPRYYRLMCWRLSQAYSTSFEWDVNQWGLRAVAYDTFLFEKAEQIAIITFNRP